MIHHVGLANYDRRELLYPMIEQLMAAGEGDADCLASGNVGVPLAYGDTLGVFTPAFHKIDGRTVERA